MSTLLRDDTGVALLSDQRIHEIVEEEAQRLRASNAVQARAVLARTFVLPTLNQEVAIYDGQIEEVVLFDDGIQVKKPKEHREKSSACPSTTEAGPGSECGGKQSKEKVNTDALMLQRVQDGCRSMMEGLEGVGAEGGHVSAEELGKCALLDEYGKRREVVTLVAITDGARRSRLFFERMFGLMIVLILDWYPPWRRR